MLNINHVLDHLIDHKILSKEVARISRDVNQATLYENILTDENLEPTQFLTELVKLSGYQLITKQTDDTTGFELKRIK